MRFAWVDEGSGPDFVKGAASGITGYFLSIRQGTRAQLIDIHNRGFANGLYVGHNWFGDGDSPPSITPGQYAAKVKGLLDTRRVSSTRLQLNMEQHDGPFIIGALTALRAMYPTLALSFSPEGMQGGWIWTSGLWKALIDLHVRIVPQLYFGVMADINLRSSDPAKFYADVKKGLRSERLVVNDLVRNGIPDGLISPFWPGEWLPAGADGYVFTQGRLP